MDSASTTPTKVGVQHSSPERTPTTTLEESSVIPSPSTQLLAIERELQEEETPPRHASVGGQHHAGGNATGTEPSPRSVSRDREDKLEPASLDASNISAKSAVSQMPPSPTGSAPLRIWAKKEGCSDDEALKFVFSDTPSSEVDASDLLIKAAESFDFKGVKPSDLRVVLNGKVISNRVSLLSVLREDLGDSKYAGDSSVASLLADEPPTFTIMVKEGTTASKTSGKPAPTTSSSSRGLPRVAMLGYSKQTARATSTERRNGTAWPTTTHSRSIAQSTLPKARGTSPAGQSASKVASPSPTAVARGNAPMKRTAFGSSLPKNPPATGRSGMPGGRAPSPQNGSSTARSTPSSNNARTASPSGVPRFSRTVSTGAARDPPTARGVPTSARSATTSSTMTKRTGSVERPSDGRVTPKARTASPRGLPPPSPTPHQRTSSSFSRLSSTSSRTRDSTPPPAPSGSSTTYSRTSSSSSAFRSGARSTTTTATTTTRTRAPASTRHADPTARSQQPSRATNSRLLHPPACNKFTPQWGNALCAICKQTKMHHTRPKTVPRSAATSSDAAPEGGAAANPPRDTTRKATSPFVPRVANITHRTASPSQRTQSPSQRTASPTTTATPRTRSSSAGKRTATVGGTPQRKTTPTRSHSPLKPSRNVDEVKQREESTVTGEDVPSTLTVTQGTPSSTRPAASARRSALETPKAVSPKTASPRPTSDDMTPRRGTSTKKSQLSPPAEEEVSPSARAIELEAARAFAAAERDANMFQRSVLVERMKALDRQKGTLRLLVEWRENEQEMKELRNCIVNPNVEDEDKELFRAHYKTLEERGKWLQRSVTLNDELEVTMLIRDEEALNAKLKAVEECIGDCERQLNRVDGHMQLLNESSYETLLFSMKHTVDVSHRHNTSGGVDNSSIMSMSALSHGTVSPAAELHESRTSTSDLMLGPEEGKSANVSCTAEENTNE